MRIFKIALAIILSLVDILQIGIAFLLASKSYEGYSYNGQLGAWRMYIFPTMLLLFLVAGIIAVMKKKDWGYVLLCLPLILPILIQLTGLNVKFVDTSAIDEKNRDSLRQFLQDSQKL